MAQKPHQSGWEEDSSQFAFLVVVIVIVGLIAIAVMSREPKKYAIALEGGRPVATSNLTTRVI